MALNGKHFEVVRRLLQHPGICVDAMDRKGDTPLMLAVQLGQTEIARALIEAGASAERLDATSSQLRAAAEFGWVELVALLLDHGANAWSKQSGHGLVDVALRKQKFDVARVIAVHPSSPFDHALRLAAKLGDLDAVKQVLARKDADVKYDELNARMVWQGIRGSNAVAILHALMDAGLPIDFSEAVIHFSGGERRTLYMGDWNNEDDEENWDDEEEFRCRGPRPLPDDFGWRVDIVRDIISRGLADVNAHKDNKLHEDTPLVRAAGRGNIALVRYLLSQGALLGSPISNSALAAACRVKGEHRELLAELLSACAGPSHGGHLTQALAMASMLGKPNLVRDLLSAGANVNGEVREFSAITYCVANNFNEEIAQALLDAGASINVGPDAPSPLAMACRWGSNHAAIEWLLEKGADPRAGDHNPVYSATRARWPRSTLKLLLDLGVPLTLTAAGYHRNALREAIYWGKPESIDTLISFGFPVDHVDADGRSAADDIAQPGVSGEIVDVYMEAHQRFQLQIAFVASFAAASGLLGDGEDEGGGRDEDEDVGVGGDGGNDDDGDEHGPDDPVAQGAFAHPEGLGDPQLSGNEDSDSDSDRHLGGGGGEGVVSETDEEMD
jgi:ankyrin repeat protein